MFFSSIGLIIAGIILWLVIGPALMYVGIGSYTTGWWIFSETHYYLTTLGWIGFGLIIAGLTIFIIGIGLIIVVVILEVMEKKRPKQQHLKNKLSIPVFYFVYHSCFLNLPTLPTFLTLVFFLFFPNLSFNWFCD